MKNLIFILFLMVTSGAFAQGPPILVEKPIMLGQNRSELRLFYRNETRPNLKKYQSANFSYDIVGNQFWSIGVAGSYYMNSYINTYDVVNDKVEPFDGFGDLAINLKYQFLRKDYVGKTYRMLGKIKQTFPTGEYKNDPFIGNNEYETAISIVGGYESLKYGILHELGYNYSPTKEGRYLKFDLGFGLPLLKSKVPIRQINLYFEYQSKYHPYDEGPTHFDNFEAYYAQSIQFAAGVFTFEATYLWPLYRVHDGHFSKKEMFQIGSRMIL